MESGGMVPSWSRSWEVTWWYRCRLYTGALGSLMLDLISGGCPSNCRSIDHKVGPLFLFLQLFCCPFFHYVPQLALPLPILTLHWRLWMYPTTETGRAFVLVLKHWYNIRGTEHCTLAKLYVVVEKKRNPHTKHPIIDIKLTCSCYIHLLRCWIKPRAALVAQFVRVYDFLQSGLCSTWSSLFSLQPSFCIVYGSSNCLVDVCTFSTIALI